MWTLFKEGGFPMWIVVGFGLVALVTAFAFAVRPNEENVRFIKSMSAATVLAAIGGTAIDFSTVAHYVAFNEKLTAEMRVNHVLEGFGESMAPTVFGLTFASLVAMLLAVGARRIDARKA
jgi:hypothetical protein